jgi:hypothetical protein
MQDDLKNYREDAFQLIPPEVAGALVGAFVAALFVYDVLNRIGEWLTR